MKNLNNIKIQRRKIKNTQKIRKVSDRVRILVKKSLKYDYIQAIDDKKNKTIFSTNTQKIKDGKKIEKDKKIAEEMANYLVKNKIKKIVFDRNGYKYHGRVKIIAETLRKNQIIF